ASPSRFETAFMFISTSATTDATLRPSVATTPHAEIKTNDIARAVPVFDDVHYSTPAEHQEIGVPRERSEIANRIVNVAVASVALVAVAPIMAVFAALVKLTSRGPIFYSQARVGIDRRWRGGDSKMYDRRARDLGGSVFTIYKFRSMYVNAEQRSG